MGCKGPQDGRLQLAPLGHQDHVDRRAVLQLATKVNIEMPITQAVGDVLDGRMPPHAAIEGLMSRRLKAE